jgi:hypothetical protein
MATSRESNLEISNRSNEKRDHKDIGKEKTSGTMLEEWLRTLFLFQ